MRVDLHHYPDFFVTEKQVWFGETNIRHGGAWEMSIEEGLAASDVVIAMMTPHAVRRPEGECLDELSFARFSGKRILPLMVEDCRPPLCISRLQWLDLRGYEETLERWRRFKECVRPMLEILTAAYEPLPLVTLSEILGWDNYGRKRALDSLGSLITSRDGRLSFFHERRAKGFA